MLSVSRSDFFQSEPERGGGRLLRFTENEGARAAGEIREYRERERERDGEQGHLLSRAVCAQSRRCNVPAAATDGVTPVRSHKPKKAQQGRMQVSAWRRAHCVLCCGPAQTTNLQRLAGHDSPACSPSYHTKCNAHRLLHRCDCPSCSCGS